MNPGFILVLSFFIQLITGMLSKALFPSFVASVYYEYLQIPLTTLLSIFIPSYLYIKNEKKSYLTDFGESVKPDKIMIICIGVGLCLQFLSILVNLPVNILLSSLSVQLSSKFPPATSPFMFVISIISFAVFPAFFEEILFRGIVFNYYRKYGNKAAILISSLLFALLHLSLPNFLGSFLMGIIFGTVFSYTNRIIYPFITHFTVNASAVIISCLTTVSPIAESFYEDFFIVLLTVSVPAAFYLLRYLKAHTPGYNYFDINKHIFTMEYIVNINDSDSIRILEHDERENNTALAFKELVSSPYFYILLILFIYFGGSILW